MRRNVFARYVARRRYFAAQGEAGQAWVDLAASDGTAVTRWETLAWLADCERTMVHTAFGFRRADVRDSDGFTVAESHDMAAVLLAVVADTEFATLRLSTADLMGSMPAWSSARSQWTSLASDQTVVSFLARLSETDSARARAFLVLGLCDAVVGHVGGQAAEVLASVAFTYFVASGLSTAEAARLTGPKRAGGEG